MCDCQPFTYSPQSTLGPTASQVSGDARTHSISRNRTASAAAPRCILLGQLVAKCQVLVERNSTLINAPAGCRVRLGVAVACGTREPPSRLIAGGHAAGERRCWPLLQITLW